LNASARSPESPVFAPLHYHPPLVGSQLLTRLISGPASGASGPRAGARTAEDTHPKRGGGRRLGWGEGRRTQDEGQATGVNVPAKNGRNDWGYVCSSDKKNQVNWSWGAIFSPFFLFGPVLISSKCRFKR